MGGSESSTRVKRYDSEEWAGAGWVGPLMVDICTRNLVATSYCINNFLYFYPIYSIIIIAIYCIKISL